MRRVKGGYYPDSRISTLKDEIVMEALVGANSPSIEVRRRTFREIRRLARQVRGLLAQA